MIPTPTITTFRDKIRRITPIWLRFGNNEKVLYTLGLHLDLLGDTIVAAVKSRYPGLITFESLSLIARDRRMIRGRNETPGGFAERLTRWLADHQHRGNVQTLLAQLHLYYQPNNAPVELVYANGVRLAMGADGVVTRTNVPWSPDTAPTRWARWWLFRMTDDYADTPPSAADVDDLRTIPHAFNAAHAQGTIVLVPTGGELWNWPAGHTWNEPGTWNTPGVRFIDVGL